MRPKVFVANPVPEQVENYLAEECDYRIWREKEQIPDEVLLKEIKDVDGLLISKVNVDENLLQHAPNLKVISNIAVGYEGFDTELMAEHKVLGTHTPYVLDETVADLVFGLILSSARRICELDRYVKQGDWKKSDNDLLFGKDVHHATLGIVGMGRISEKIVRRAKFGFDMDVLYYNRSKKDELEEQYGIKERSLEDLLKESDFVVVMLPLTKETEQIIDKEQFEWMKKDAVFINASRGQVINEKALIDALNDGKILAAGLDVFEKEPVDKDNPLLSMDHVVTTPHIGSAVKETREQMAMTAAKNVVAGAKGEVPPNIVKELKCLCQT